MTAIASTDISAASFYPVNIGKTQNRGRNTPIEVTVDISVVTTTNVDYVAGTGLPLDALFTQGNASDTGLDPAQKIVQVGGAFLRRSASVFTNCLFAQFKQGGTTAATQKLMLHTIPINAAQLAPIEVGGANATATDLTAATNLNGAGPHVCQITLRGMLREGATISGIDR